VIKDKPSLDDIISEWNTNAAARHAQIVSGVDISYREILIPTIIGLIGDVSDKRIIDVGCGSGYLTAKLASCGANVAGVDPSSNMIRIAKNEYRNIPHLKFINETIEAFSSQHPNTDFDIAVSNMSLITIANMDTALMAINRLLIPNGVFVFNITHPCFYNQHRRYEPTTSFQYLLPHAQKGNFIISNDTKALPARTTHFHRPLQEYLRSLRAASFVVDKLVEPFPTPKTEKLYPKPWKTPRFLSMRCIKAH
jgi:2-polyprenyl-3-methyl-5-hydroxy-6-metoxy-1,4-benzoquinol methylase